VQAVFEKNRITDEDGTGFGLANPFRGILGPVEKTNHSPQRKISA